jgi:nucleoid-associated protein YgaU
LNPTSEPEIESGSIEDLNPPRGQNSDTADRPSASFAEPLVVSIPSSRPQRSEADETLEEQDNTVDGDEESSASPKGNMAARILSGLAPVAKGAGSAAKQGVRLARGYPRASMASGLSAAILTGVMVLQPGKGKHDTTAAIPNPNQAAQSPMNPADPKASSARKPDAPSPDASQAQAAAESDPPIMFEGQNPKAGKTPPDPAGGPAAVADSRPAPAPTESIPPLPDDPVKLTAGEGLVQLPPIGKDGAQSVVGAGEKSADPAPAPAPPILELAANDTKPGTPPEPASAPAPAPSIAAPSPAPTPAPAPAAKTGPGSHLPDPPASALAPVPEPARESKPAADDPIASTLAKDTAGSAASGTAKAAAAAGGIGLSVGAGLGAAVTALSKGNDHKDPGTEKSPAKPAPALEPLIAPASAPSTLADPKPIGLPGGPVTEPAKTSASPPDHEPPSAGPTPVSPGSVPEADPAPSRVEPMPPAADIPTLHPAADPGPHKTVGDDPPIQGQNPIPSVTPPQDEPKPPFPVERDAPNLRDELTKQGWVPIKRSGGDMVRDVQRDVPGPEDDLSAETTSRAGTTDPGAHADKEQSFDIEAPSGRAVAFGAAGATAAARRASVAVEDPEVSRSARSEGKLDTVLHKVEKNENFWTISRMYYSSGRYYRALWKANAAKVPEIDKLYRDTVIRIPPPEDLDPAYIDPPGMRAPRSGGENLAAQDAAPDRSSSGRSIPADGVPIRRSSRSDADLNLPVADVATEKADGSPRSSRRNSSSSGSSSIRDDRDDDREPEIRPRDAVARPIYKVRQYDTLRTIARDTLGDARRADEILELNRDIVSDPSHLIVGQILDLPEDARPARARSRR